MGFKPGLDDLSRHLKNSTWNQGALLHPASRLEGPLEARAARVTMQPLDSTGAGVLASRSHLKSHGWTADQPTHTTVQLSFSPRELISFSLAPTCNLNLIRVFTLLNQVRKIDARWSETIEDNHSTAGACLDVSVLHNSSLRNTIVLHNEPWVIGMSCLVRCFCIDMHCNVGWRESWAKNAHSKAHYLFTFLSLSLKELNQVSWDWFKNMQDWWDFHTTCD